jgi:L-seryl-tRNA(Ser) seleniumtransferase
VRIDKLALAALDATLRLHRDPARALREIPVLAMIGASEEELAARAERIRAGIAAADAPADVRVTRAAGRAGGGALPLLELEGPVVAVTPAVGGAEALHERLREGDPPVVARVREDALLIDPRTIAEVEVDFVVRAAIAALRPAAPS